MRVLEFLGGANDWRGGRLMLRVQLETSSVRCSNCGLPMRAGVVAFYFSDPPKPARIAHPKGKCPTR